MTDEKKPKDYPRRVKFPRTRRDRLKGPNDAHTAGHPGLISRLSSIHSISGQVPYRGAPDPSRRVQRRYQSGRRPPPGKLDGGLQRGAVSYDDIGRVYPPAYPPHPHWQQQQQPYFGGDPPLAGNEDSWSEWGPRMRENDRQIYDTLDSGKPQRPDEISPTSNTSRVAFRFPPGHDERDNRGGGDEYPRRWSEAGSRHLPSEADSFAEFNDTLPRTGMPDKREDDSHLGSLILWGQEIASCSNYFFPTVGIIGYILDTTFDVLLAIKYFYEGLMYYFALTLIFIILPTVLMTIFSVILWVRNSRIIRDKVSTWQWVLRTISVFFQMTPVVRSIEVIHFAWRSRSDKHDWYHRRRCYERMLDEDTDVSLIRLFETFLENAPQLVLQLYVMITIGGAKGYVLVTLQVLGLICSWLVMAWSIVSFHAALRASLPDKAKLTIQGRLGMFLWRLFTIAPRVLAMAMFAAAFSFYILVFCAAHFFIMLIWVSKQKTVYCLFKVIDESGKARTHHSPVLEFGFRVMAAFLHIFCFINLLEGHSRLRCIVFYVVMYLENVALVMIWYVKASTMSDSNWYHIPALMVVTVGFFIGIFFQVTYYMCCHPNNYLEVMKESRIKWYVPCKDLSMFNGLDIYEVGVTDEASVGGDVTANSRSNPKPNLDTSYATQVSYGAPRPVSIGSARFPHSEPDLRYGGNAPIYKGKQDYNRPQIPATTAERERLNPEDKRRSQSQQQLPPSGQQSFEGPRSQPRSLPPVSAYPPQAPQYPPQQQQYQSPPHGGPTPIHGQPPPPGGSAPQQKQWRGPEEKPDNQPQQRDPPSRHQPQRRSWRMVDPETEPADTIQYKTTMV